MSFASTGSALERSPSFVNRHQEGDILVRSFIKAEVEDDADPDGGCRCSGNVRVLLVTTILFSTITIAQTIAAKIAKSDALLADCVSMGVDALTYFLNIWVEILKGDRIKRKAQLIVPVISISLLTYFTIDVIQEALETLRDAGDEGDGDEVNPFIVLAFAVWGIVFDAVSMFVFWRNAKASGSSLGINMMAAFLHVGADFARSITTLVESILIIGFGFDGAITDAWACLIVSITILLGAAYASYEWVVEACYSARSVPANQSTIAQAGHPLASPT